MRGVQGSTKLSFRISTGKGDFCTQITAFKDTRSTLLLAGASDFPLTQAMQEKGRQAEFDPITEMEISSILDSGLPSHEKSALLASYFSEDNTSGSSSGITVQEKTNHKKADTKSNAPPEEIKNKASCSSSGVELQEKNKHRDEANAKEEHNSDKEPELKESSLSHPSSEQGKGKHMGAMAKEKDNDHLLCKDEKSEVQDDDKSLSHPTSQQAKTKGALDDPLTNEEISSILHSTLSKKDKLSLLILSNLNGVENSPLETKTSTSTTPLKVEVKEKVQHNETEVKRDVEDHLPSDDRKIDERLSHSSPRQEEQAKVYPNFKLTSDEKSQPLVYDRTEVDVRWSKLSSSSTSSRNEFKGKGHQHVETEGKDEHDNGSLKWIDEAGSTFLSQRVHVEDSHVSLELKHELVIAKVEGAQNINVLFSGIPSPQYSQVVWLEKVRKTEYLEYKGIRRPKKGEEDETINKEEVVCKYCFKNMINEENVLKAKCKCKLTLIHEECAKIWSAEKGNKCTACEEEIRNIHVTLVMATSFPSQTGVEKFDKPTSVSTRCWSCLFNF